jgi:hypothetical protein
MTAQSDRSSDYHTRRLGLRKRSDAKIVEWRRVSHLVSNTLFDYGMTTCCGQYKNWANVVRAHKTLELSRINCLMCLASARGKKA